MKNLKREVARIALDYLVPGQTIGLGAGATISYVAEMISDEIPFKETLKFISPSPHTSEVLNKYGLSLIDPVELNKIDIYFDSCDQVDENLNAFKSGGGIHTKEKLFASIASEFILLVDASKVVPALTTEFPLCIELFPEVPTFVTNYISGLYPDSSIKLRMNAETHLPIINDSGNLLADVHFKHLPPLDELNDAVLAIPGIVDHSLFYDLATKVLIAEQTGIKELSRNR